MVETVNKTQHTQCRFLCSSSSIVPIDKLLENKVSLYDIEHATRLLMGWQSRDKDASQELFHHVYDDIKAVIANLMRTQRPTDTLLRESSVTELANESIVKLHRWRHDETPMESRRDFFEYVRVSVWHLLFGKPHHCLDKVSTSEQLLEQVQEAIPAEFSSQHELNRDLYIALEEMRSRYPRQFEVFELKHFSTASITEIADLKGVSKRTVDNDLKFAQVWLQKKLS